jgi:hypothetical protein
MIQFLPSLTLLGRFQGSKTLKLLPNPGKPLTPFFSYLIGVSQ